MGYRTEKVFGRREKAHIASPSFLNLPKVELDVPDGVKISSGEFVGADGNKVTLGTEKKAFFIVLEDSFYQDYAGRNKPSGVVEAYFGEYLLHTKVFEEDGTAFDVGDKVTIINGKIAHLGTDNTVAVGEVVGRGADWLAITMY